MRLTVEERVFILESYLKTLSFAHCRQSVFEKFRSNRRDLKQLKMNIARAIEEENEITLEKFRGT
jgi:CRISPR/Cas system-associated endoribonuclease Cas2